MRKRTDLTRGVAWAVVAVVAITSVIVPWVGKPPVLPRWSVAFAGLTLAAAVAAVLLALPGYQEWLKSQRARPRMSLWFEFGPKLQKETRDNRNVLLGRQDIFSVRVIVRNDGDAPLRWAILNIVVLAACQIKPDEGEAILKSHYAAPWPAGNDEILPDQAGAKVNFTFAERDFPPGHHFTYHVQITVPKGKGTWPVLAVLEGTPPPRVVERTDLVVARD